MSPEGGWAEQRREAALVHEQRLREKQAGEIAAARGLIDAFLVRARARGVEPEALVARDYSGGGPYRTGLRGWYVRANKSAAVGEDGQFYVLTGAGGLKARLTGARPEPSDPPIILGKGGRDGESIDLRDALARVVPED